MRYSLLVFLSLLLLSGCHKKDDAVDLCELQQDINLGAIAGVLDIRCPYAEGETFIIQDRETYENIAGACAEEELPAIDFGRYHLLGVTTGASGCDRFYLRTVTVNHLKKTYRYEVKVEECGLCEPWVVRTHWVLVPPVPEGYSVRFRTSRREGF